MDKTQARRAAFLIMVVFAMQPLALGGWFGLIPFIKESLGLSKGELALALLGLPVGLVPAIQVAGGVVTRFGLRRIFQIIFPIQSLAVLLPLAAWNVPTLFLALACFGATTAFLEVGMNVYAGRLEKRADVMIMQRSHGCWALGLVAGSGFVAAMVSVSPAASLVPLAVVSGVLGVLASRMMPQLVSNEEGTTPARRHIRDVPRPVLYIAAFMFFATMTEGAMADWAAVYLAERLGEVGGQASLAVTIFTAALAGTRFAGDWAKRRLGAVTLARATTACAIIGVLCLVLPLPLAFAYLGFALVGVGVAVAYPLGVSAVAAVDDRHESANIAMMATIALGGFLMGPPVIGGIAEFTSLPFGLAALIPGLCVALVLTKWFRTPRFTDSESDEAPIPR